MVEVLTAIDPDAIAALRARGSFFWLDLAGPSPAEVDTLGEVFGFHPLALEDTRKFGQRPKLDDYEDSMLLVFYGARRDERGDPDLVEVHLFVTGEFCVTVRRDGCPELDLLRARLAARAPRTEQTVIYEIVDTLTDTFFPVLADVDDAIDALQDAMLEEPTDEQLQRIFRLKRSLVTLRRVVAPQRDIFARAIDRLMDLPGLEGGDRDYFRDVYDHLIRISDLIDSFRDLLTGALDVYLSTVSNRLNAIMKQLTILATVFIPLTVLTGFFGQNFGWMVRHVDSLAAFMVLGVGGLIGTCVAMYAWFRHAGWI